MQNHATALDDRTADKATPRDVGLDEFQARALADILGSPFGSAHLIAGAGGTGKTTCLLTLAKELAGQRVMVLAANRHAADQLRGELTRRIGTLPSQMAVRTPHAWAFSIAQDFAADRGRHTPELITGPKQDAILAEVLEETENRIDWPEAITPEVRQLPAFRHQLRDLLTRAAEFGLDPQGLIDLGRQADEPMWLAAGHVYEAYRSSLLLADALEVGGTGADRLDHASMLRTAQSYLAEPESWSDAGNMPQWEWVLVDDYENATLATAALLGEVQRTGTRLVLTADPDGAVEGFRGGIAHLPAAARTDTPDIGFSAQLHTLRQCHRAGKQLARARAILTSEISAAGLVRQREPQPGAGEDDLEVRTFSHRDAEFADIARFLRRRHIRDGEDYNDMAVLTRSRSEHREIERVLNQAGVMVRPAPDTLPLRYSPLVRDLMGVLSAAIDRAAGQSWAELGEVRLRGLLTGPLLGMTGRRLRQCERHLRPFASERGLSPVVAALEHEPEAWWAEDIVRLGRIIDETARSAGRGAEEALRVAWTAAEQGEPWQSRALGEPAPQADGIDERSANRLLDEAMRLFRFAQRMVDRDPAASAADLLEALSQQELLEDSIASQGAAFGVHLLTPAMAVGRQFNTVVIASLEDGVWPNTRIRDGIFGAGRLSDLLLGRVVDAGGSAEATARARGSAIRSVLDDELRMLVFSLSRATSTVLLTAVDSEDSSPSRFIDRLSLEGIEVHKVDGTRIALTLTGIVGSLRAVLTDPQLRVDSADRQGAAALLAALARAGVPGADPDEWLDMIEPTELRPWRTTMAVSPSQIEQMTQCPLRWFATSSGLTDVEDRDAMDLGTLIHAIAEDAARGEEDLDARFEARMGQYLARFDSGFERDTRAARAKKIYHTLKSYLLTAAEGVAEHRVAATYEAEAGTIEIAGRIDRIEDRDQAPYVIDFKTGAQAAKLKEAARNPQLRSYQWALEQERGVPTSGASLIFVGDPLSSGKPKERKQPALNEEARSELIDLFEDTACIITGASLEARPNDGCGRCPIAVMCPAVQKGRVFS
ncbi:MAG: PD-(D/E)XK nuclease family protein [Flaviflexus sp.]|nr:PD-(D/E)XK nuclease family protein [Flaviflexus sp.]